jgi:hypothetical protein
MNTPLLDGIRKEALSPTSISNVSQSLIKKVMKSKLSPAQIRNMLSKYPNITGSGGFGFWARQAMNPITGRQIIPRLSKARHARKLFGHMNLKDPGFLEGLAVRMTNGSVLL